MYFESKHIAHSAARHHHPAQRIWKAGFGAFYALAEDGLALIGTLRVAAAVNELAKAA
jgi:hypothetical protein